MSIWTREEFSAEVRRTIAFRVGSRCSLCYEATSGPQIDPTKALNLGVAAHITAASPGGPRFDPQLTTAQRRHATNAIWLCQKCAKLIDNDPDRFSVAELRRRKNQAEAVAFNLLSKTENHVSSVETGEGFTELAVQLAQSQIHKFRWVRRYPFTLIDRVNIGDALRLTADQRSETQGREHLRIPVGQLLELNRTAVLFGEPGAGKSTALQQVTHDHAASYSAGTHLMPPLYVDLKWLSSDLVRFVETTILDLCPSIDLKTVSQFLLTSPLSYYLDSFDEASNPEQLLREIRALVSQHHQSRFLIASRPNVLLGNLDFANYELAPLNRAQIREILELYLRPHLTHEEIWRIYEHIQQFGLFSELGNPMMLWFLSLAVRDLGSAMNPEYLGKGQIFNRVVESYFLSTWEAKSLKPWTPKARKYAAIKTNLLSSLARTMVEDDDRVVVSEQLVFEHFVKDLSNQYPNPSDLAHEILDQILTHHLLEQNDSHLAFWHKSLRNFFAAKYLANESDFSSLQAFAQHTRWHEPIIMLASLDSRFKDAIASIANESAILALDCLNFSEFSKEVTAVQSVVNAALRKFLSPGRLDHRVHLVQRIVTLYRNQPELIGEAILTFLADDAPRSEKKAYQALLDYKDTFFAVVEWLKTKLIEAEVPAQIESEILSMGRFIHQRSKSNVNEVDVFTIRVLTPDELRHCYAALGVVHNNWKPLPGRIKDWIATPRHQHYQALHTTVIGRWSGNLTVTVIIQTTEMRRRELQLRPADSDPYSTAMTDLEEMQKALGLSPVPVLSLLAGTQTITILTLNDGLLLLEEDATVLDCAHRIHSEIFQHCQGGIVNGKTVHIGYPLKNMDRVEIITNPCVQPESHWVSHITSPSAKKALGRILRRREEAEAIASGKRQVEKYITEIAAKTREAPETVERTLKRRFGLHKIADLYKGVGRGKYVLGTER